MDKPKMRKKWRHINRRRSSQHKIIKNIVWELTFSLWGGFFFGRGCTVALQCCVSFCYTTKCISYTYTYIPHRLEPPPSPPSPFHVAAEHRAAEHRAELPVLHSCFPPALCFAHGTADTPIHISQSTLTPSSPLPHDCSPHLHLYSCPTNRFICTIFLDSTYVR